MWNTKSVGLAAAELHEQSAAPTSTAVLASRRRILLVVAVVVVVVDQVSKWWALRTLDDRTIDGPLGSALRLVYNTGSAFSLGSGFGPLFGALAVLVAIAMFWIVRNVEHRVVVVGLGMVQGGAIGNVIDRTFRDGEGGVLGGAVIDFLEVGDWWPVFNIADAAIVVGGVIVVLFGSRG